MRTSVFALVSSSTWLVASCSANFAPDASLLRSASPALSLGNSAEKIQIVGRRARGVRLDISERSLGEDCRVSCKSVDRILPLAQREGALQSDSAEVTYRIALPESIVSLRLVENVVEFLDERGTPRWRFSGASLIGDDQRRAKGEILVQSCEVDQSLASPWNRALVPAGSAECDLAIHFDATEISLPGTLEGSWSTTAAMSTPRAFHTATMLADGRVLVAAGLGRQYEPLTSAELYDPASETWAMTGALGHSRYSHSTTLLLNGSVLVVSGSTSPIMGVPSSELYDPSSGRWHDSGSVITSRMDHVAILMPNGEVFIIGGNFPYYLQPRPLASTEFYNPETGVWRDGPSMGTRRDHHTASLLSDGRVLVTGGAAPPMPEAFASTEVYAPATGEWSPTAPMSTPRLNHAATVLLDGSVLVTGGDDEDSLPTAELYDPLQDVWSATPPMSVNRASHSATLLSDGRVLVAGGNGSTLTEVFNLSSGSWLDSDNLHEARAGHTASLLLDGSVLVTGGDPGLAPLDTVERFRP